MVESAENRTRYDPQFPWKMLASDRDCRRPGRRVLEARTEAGVRAAAVIMEPPYAKNPLQMLVPEGNQEVQTLST